MSGNDLENNNETQFIIRPALPADIGERGEGKLRDIFNAVRRSERAQRRSPLDPPHYDRWAETMEAQAKGSQRHQALLAEKDGKPVGFCHAVHTLRNTHTTLNVLFIAPDVQKSGLGRQFIEAVVIRAGTLGKQEVRVSAEHGKDKATHFYQHLGFKVTETEELKDGGKKDHLVLALQAP